MELDYLFDQRLVNLNPNYEDISLTSNKKNIPATTIKSNHNSSNCLKKEKIRAEKIDENNDYYESEHIDLTDTYSSNTSLKLVKGLLLYKGRGKNKQISLFYKLD